RTERITRMSETNVAVHPVVRHLDLFSGIGGFALAAQMVGGIETVGFCEIDPWARKVLAKNFPGVPCHEDVKTLDPKDYGRIDLITGGYPCQPFSAAGERRGEEDDRHLWPEVRRIIERCRPRWVLCENVAGHVTLGLDAVLSEMESLGYTCRATVIPACAVDAKHRRDRVWILANSEHLRSEIGHAQRPESNRQRQASDAVPRRSLVANSLGPGLEGFAGHGTNGNQPGRINQDARRSTPTPCVWHGEREWFAESGMGRVANGIPKRVDRLRGLGNAIVPQVAAEILRVMMEVDSQTNDKS
ncbi:MAG: DNA cytosine methyltransferase, partial [Pontimonas sp.]